MQRHQHGLPILQRQRGLSVPQRQPVRGAEPVCVGVARLRESQHSLSVPVGEADQERHPGCRVLFVRQPVQQLRRDVVVDVREQIGGDPPHHRVGVPQTAEQRYESDGVHGLKQLFPLLSLGRPGALELLPESSFQSLQRTVVERTMLAVLVQVVVEVRCQLPAVESHRHSPPRREGR
ncbi:hypothetical protein [Kribbella sp. NPDC051718]|uniref:hypothetical protein n=1 Tax=Kribbella sp. NPDC051718 TaxID=3155168 RepID=UPI00341F7B8A